MKNLFLTTIITLMLGFTGISCSSDNDNSSESIIQTSELPTEPKIFIDTYFSDAEIIRIERDTNSIDGYYEVYFVGGIQIDFDESGVWTEVDGNNQAIPTGFINPDIMIYVITNYPAVLIESIGKKPYGFDIDLVNNIELRFDTEGNFLETGN